MDVMRSLLGCCLSMVLLPGAATGSSAVSSVREDKALSKIDGSKPQTPAPAPRKRRPYDPEKQPPETSPGAGQTKPATDQFSQCMPAEVNPESLVTVRPSKPGSSAKVTVRMRLTQLKARCKRGKLVDGKGRQIYLYPLVGCWGNPPENYLELLQQQTEEIQRLQRRYTVIEIPCGPVGPNLIS